MELENILKQKTEMKLVDFRFDYFININHWSPLHNQISIRVINRCDKELTLYPMKILSSVDIPEYTFSQNYITLLPKANKEIVLFLPKDLIVLKEKFLLIFKILDKTQENIEFVELRIPKWINFIKYVFIWQRTRDIKYLSAKIKENRLIIHKTLFELCDIVFRYFGFFEWTHYINDFSKSYPTIKINLEKNLDKTFANMISGWTGAGRYKIITSPQELKSFIQFIEFNTELNTPNIENIRSIIEEQASKRNVNNDDLFRINNVLSGIGTDIFTLQLYNNALNDIENKNIPNLNISNDSEIIVDKYKLEKMISEAKKITFYEIDEKIKAFQKCLIPTILQKNLENLTYIISNISYLKGSKFHQERRNAIAYSYYNLALRGFQILESEQMLKRCSYNLIRCDFYEKKNNGKTKDATIVLDYLASNLMEFSTVIDIGTIYKFLLIGYYNTSLNYYIVRESELAIENRDKVAIFLEKVKEYNISLYNDFSKLLLAFNNELKASQLSYDKHLSEIINLLEETKKIYFDLGEETRGKPFIHIILNYKGLLEMQNGKFKEAQSLFLKAYKIATKFDHDGSLYKARTDICKLFLNLKDRNWKKLKGIFKKIYGYRYKRSTYVMIKTLEIISDLIQKIEENSITRLELADITNKFVKISCYEDGYIISDTLVNLFFEICASATLKLLNYPDTIVNKIQKTAIERISSEGFIKQEFALVSLVDLLERPWAFYLYENALLRYRKFEEYKFIDPHSVSLREDGLFRLLSALEIQLLYILEYYWKLLFKEKADEKILEKYDGKSFNKFAFRDIIQGFVLISSERPDIFGNYDKDWSYIENGIIPIRNKLAHGKIKQLTLVKIIEIENYILSIFKKLLTITPIHFRIHDKIIDKYKVEFMVEVPFITRLISTNEDLVVGNEYYGLIETQTKDEIIIRDIIACKKSQ